MRRMNEFQAGPVLPQSVISSGNSSFTQHGQKSSNRKTRQFCPSLYIHHTPPFENAPGISTYQHRLFNCCIVSITCPIVQDRSVSPRLAPWHKNWNLTALFFSNAGQIILEIPNYQRRLVSYCVVSITCQPIQHRNIPPRLAPWHKNWNLSVLFFSNFDIVLEIPIYQRRLVSSSITYLPVQHRSIRSRVAPLDKN